jgi:hypothetical protein
LDQQDLRGNQAPKTKGITNSKPTQAELLLQMLAAGIRQPGKGGMGG